MTTVVLNETFSLFSKQERSENLYSRERGNGQELLRDLAHSCPIQRRVVALLVFNLSDQTRALGK